jgi:hypothetical protein
MWQNVKRATIILMILAVGAGMVGCKSQKKLAQERAEAEYAAMVNDAKSDLEAFINGTSKMSLDAKEDRLAEIKNSNIDDPAIQNMIKQAEEVLAAERSALIKKELEEKRKAEEAAKREQASTSLATYFSSIASSASSSEANMIVNQALKLFASPDTPVLIIISKTADGVDYDRPTTILNYLNYLKDTKNNINVVENVKYDANGKITELELMKKL